MAHHRTLATLAACISALLVSQSGFADAASNKSNVIEFVTHPKNTDGQVACALFAQSGWLKTPVKSAFAKIKGNTAICVFANVYPGTYGISAFHDENKNRKLDTNLIGLPTEDYCASRDARGTFGPPSFNDAKFAYANGKVRLTAQLK